MCVCVRVCECVCEMEIYISDSMLSSVNDKLEILLVTKHVLLYYIASLTVSVKRNVCFYVTLLLFLI